MIELATADANPLGKMMQVLNEGLEQAKVKLKQENIGTQVNKLILTHDDSTATMDIGSSYRTKQSYVTYLDEFQEMLTRRENNEGSKKR